MQGSQSQVAGDTALEDLVHRRPVVLVFLPNTNELQRFVLSGAFGKIAGDYRLHYVLPVEDAEKMRAATPLIDSSNSSTLAVAKERFAVWQEVFRTATIDYGDLSSSFAIRAGIPLNTGRLKAMSPAERADYDVAYEAKIDALLAGLEPLPEILDLFVRFDPLFCIVPSSLLDLFCNDVVWACDEEGVGCLVLQSGWDNISSKGILHRRTTYLGCWGPQSTGHAKKIQRMSRTLTGELGAPHYEFLKPAADDEVRAMRAECGVSQDEQVLLFGGSFRQFDETSVLRMLDEAIDSGKLGKVKVIYRPHPWRAARKHEDNFFQHAWKHVSFDPDMRDRYEREQREAGYIKRNVPMFDMVYLSKLLSASDAVISPMSTLLLEALILGKPTLAVAFGDGKHSHDPSVTSQMTHFAEARTSGGLSWCQDPERFLDECATLLKPGRAEKQADARARLLDQVVTRSPGSYAERLEGFCRSIVEPAARKLRAQRASAARVTISHAYGANRIARDYCGLHMHEPDVPGYWMHGWIPSFHNLHTGLIALHKKDGQGAEGYDFAAQIREEKEDTQQWVSRQDQADFLRADGYKHVRAIGLPITYIPDPGVRRVPGSLLVLPPHSHKAHGVGDPIAEEYAAMIAGLKSRFRHIWVGLHEDDIAKRQWVEPFRRHGIGVFPSTDQSDPNTLVRLKRILSTFECVTTNGFGSHIALAAYCGARVSVFGPFAEFPYERMRAAHAVKIFPELLDEACYLCSEDALRKHYPFLFVDPDQAQDLRGWGAREVGEPCRLSPAELAELFQWKEPVRASVAVAGPVVGATPRRRPRVLFGMAHAGFYRNFEDTVATLLAEDVDVHVAFSKPHESISLSDYREHLPGPHGQFTAETLEPSRCNDTSERLRVLRDVVFYSRPEFRRARDLRTRFPGLQKADQVTGFEQAVLRRLLPLIGTAGRNLVDLKLRQRDERCAPKATALEVLDRVRPDCVVVTPLVNFASREVDLVKAARLRGIPTLLATASWDNLTNKGVIKAMPDRVAVWNSDMADEAVRLHGVRADRVSVVGAAPFDGWFGRRPSRDRKAFFAQVGLRQGEPLIVYLCSSLSIAPGEQRVLREWIGGLYFIDLLRGANKLIRPHPMGGASWVKEVGGATATDGEASPWKQALVWPLLSQHPSSPEARADFFDTLYHADAIVGLNTSAMIEASILGKPVLTFTGHILSDTQAGNLHFRYLVEGGFVQSASGLDEHYAQLAAALAAPGAAEERCRRFVERFVRPLGRGVSASAALARLIADDLDKATGSATDRAAAPTGTEA